MTTSHKAAAIDLNTANQSELEAYISKQHLSAEALVDSSVAAGNKFKTSERLLAAYLNSTIDPEETQSGLVVMHWYEVAYRATGDLANRTQKEKKIIFGYYKAQDYANPSVPWSRIRVIAEELVTGEPKKAERAKVRDLHVRFCEELGKLYKAGNDPANDETIMNHPKSAAIRAALINVTKGLKELGVNLDTLATEG